MKDYKLLNYLSRGIRSHILYRLLMCLPFIAVVFYLRSYHGTFINNAQVEWQYVRSDEGKVYLALDVYSPSGIKIDGISSHSREITDSWRLINYPDWYKGEGNFKSLSKFEYILHPYLPYNSDFEKLYSSNEWYTFLYEWNPTDKKPIPDERTIRIRYKNIGTQNSYWAKHVPGPKINTIGINSKIEAFISSLREENFIPQSNYIYLGRGEDCQVHHIPGKYILTSALELSFNWRLIKQKGEAKAMCVVNYLNCRKEVIAKMTYNLTAPSDSENQVKLNSGQDEVFGVTQMIKGVQRIKRNLSKEFDKLTLLNKQAIQLQHIAGIYPLNQTPSYVTVMLLARKGSMNDEIELEIENLSINANPIETIAIGKDRPILNIPILHPFSYFHESLKKDNLKCYSYFSKCDYRGVKRNDYVLSIQDENGDYIDILKGTVLWDKEKALHVYYKSHTSNGNMGGANAIDYTEVFTHLALTLFMVYFVLICSYVGHVFMKQCDITLNGYASNFVISTFLGAILLTYLFFVIGTLKLLYFELVFAVLLIGLFLAYESNREVICNFKAFLIYESQKLKEAPWRIVFIILLLGILFYNFSYCFVPATSADASSDITNSYLPLLNDYILSHSFKAAIQNSTIGLNSQAADVLRTVVKMFAGEPGVYLLSFAYLLGILGAIYLIGKELFGINSMLIYITLWMFLIANLFVEHIHLGKLHIAVVWFLLISLYSIRFSWQDKNYILIPIFLAFLSSQYLFLSVVPLSYYLFVFGHSFYKGTKTSELRSYIKSLILFCLLCPIFYLKLIGEVGACFPTGALPLCLIDLFAWYNENNELYKYIDNNNIRSFYSTSLRITFGGIEDIKCIPATLSGQVEFAVILLFLPLIRKLDKYTMLYVLETMILVLFFAIFSPYSPRLVVYYMFPLFILQFAIIDGVSNWSTRYLTAGKKLALLLLIIICFHNGIFEYINNCIYYDISQHRSSMWKYCFKVETWRENILPVFTGQKSKYQYLKPGEFPDGAQGYFDHAMLIRDHTDVTDMILILPVRYHSDTNRLMTARHALGSVIYQKDMNKIMSDLKRFNINYLSFIPMSNHDYSPCYTPIFEDENFKKYFQLLFSDHNKKFYKIIHDGTNTRYSPTPYNVKGLPFIPMLKEDQI